MSTGSSGSGSGEGYLLRVPWRPASGPCGGAVRTIWAPPPEMASRYPLVALEGTGDAELASTRSGFARSAQINRGRLGCETVRRLEERARRGRWVDQSSGADEQHEARSFSPVRRHRASQHRGGTSRLIVPGIHAASPLGALHEPGRRPDVQHCGTGEGHEEQSVLTATQFVGTGSSGETGCRRARFEVAGGARCVARVAAQPPARISPSNAMPHMQRTHRVLRSREMFERCQRSACF